MTENSLVRVHHAMEVAVGIAFDRTVAESLRHANLDVISKIAAVCNYYENHGIRPDLIETVLDKKLRMVKDAESKAELKEIRKPSVPKYLHGYFWTGPFSVPEEELILWSLVSPNHKLIPAASERYAEVFRRVYGMLPDQIGFEQPCLEAPSA